ncbi:MAG: hypothetical protein PW734_07970 [Verrucomicrobium sp.]|nr:hypothetical protein [Verrucomicrobium sp.]
MTPEQLRASLQEVLGRFDFSRALPLAPGRPFTAAEKLQLAKYHVFENRYKEARELLQQLIDGGGHQEEALLLLGILCEISQDFSGAEDYYLRVLRPSVPSSEWKDPSRARWLFEHLSGQDE